MIYIGFLQDQSTTMKSFQMKTLDSCKVWSIWARYIPLSTLHHAAYWYPPWRYPPRIRGARTVHRFLDAPMSQHSLFDSYIREPSSWSKHPWLPKHVLIMQLIWLAWYSSHLWGDRHSEICLGSIGFLTGDGSQTDGIVVLQWWRTLYRTLNCSQSSWSRSWCWK